jgi:hypothetical protein
MAISDKDNQAIDERIARNQRAMLVRTGRLASWEKRVGRKGVFIGGYFNERDEFIPNKHG